MKGAVETDTAGTVVMEAARSEHIPDGRLVRRQKARARALRSISQVVIHLILIAGGIAVLIPFFWMVSTSFKTLWNMQKYCKLLKNLGTTCT